MLVVEMSIAARQREPVVFANRAMSDDLDAEVEILGHAPNDRELLVVLLAEHCDMRTCRSEQFGHHGRHAIEVARPRRSFHRVAQPADVHGGREPVGVHRRHGRRVDDLDSRLLARSEVVVDRPRVVVEVALLAELERVHEDRDDDAVSAAGCSVDQFEVAAVERPHRRDEGDGVPACTGGVRPDADTTRSVDCGGHPGNASAPRSIDPEAVVWPMDTHRRRQEHLRWSSPRARHGHRPR